jgi:dTDP-4-dehydrorhamnose reductase
MKILLSGARGQLGSAFIQRLKVMIFTLLEETI